MRASVEEALAHASMDSLVIEGNAVSLSDPKAALNLGAVAKGYAAERLAALLRAKASRRFCSTAAPAR